MNPKISIQATIHASKQKTWDFYTQANHITQWNFADPSWHCPNASNDLQVGGKYFARMEAKDGSFGFDFEGVYTEMNEGNDFSYEFGGRMASVTFTSNESENSTVVTIEFDPENENPIELQQNGWQAILNNFKNYVENN